MNKSILYAKRLVLELCRLLSILLAVSAAAFLLVLYSPNDPIESYVSKGVTNEQREVIKESWGLNKPPEERFCIWLGNACQGNLGESMVYSQSVKNVIFSRLQATIVLLGTAWCISGILGFWLGVLAGSRRGSLLDSCIKRFCLVLASAPIFWVWLLAVMLFSVELQWFPMGLAAPAGKLDADVTLGDRLYHLILPAFTLGIAGISKIALHTRAKMIDIMHSEYMLFARARGESKCTAIWHHGIRNVLLPAITLQFNSFNEIFSGSVLAEQVFSYPGLGNAATTAGLNGDANLLLGVTLISTIFVICGNRIADLLYAMFDPQIKELSAHA